MIGPSARCVTGQGPPNEPFRCEYLIVQTEVASLRALLTGQARLSASRKSPWELPQGRSASQLASAAAADEAPARKETP